jgi:hypothetical protein
VPETTSIESAQQELTDRLLSLPGIVGTGIGECQGSPCILVFLAERTDEVMTEIPTSVHGHRVETRVTGGLEALED